MVFNDLHKSLIFFFTKLSNLALLCFQEKTSTSSIFPIPINQHFDHDNYDNFDHDKFNHNNYDNFNHDNYGNFDHGRFNHDKYDSFNYDNCDHETTTALATETKTTSPNNKLQCPPQPLICSCNSCSNFVLNLRKDHRNMIARMRRWTYIYTGFALR